MTASIARPGSLVGASVRRINDPRLLRGDGRYLDDIHLDGMLHAHIVRSGSAHARITGFEVPHFMSVNCLVLTK